MHPATLRGPQGIRCRRHFSGRLCTNLGELVCGATVQCSVTAKRPWCQRYPQLSGRPRAATSVSGSDSAEFHVPTFRTTLYRYQKITSGSQS